MVITGMNSLGHQVHAEMQFYGVCMEHQNAAITLATFLTSLISAQVPKLL